jgi:proteasome accessory factor A
MRVRGSEVEHAITVYHDGQPGIQREAERRLFAPGALPSGLEVLNKGRVANNFLSNGARYYLDVGMHPEYSSPETFSALDATLVEHAGRLCMQSIGQHVDMSMRSDFDVYGGLAVMRNTADDVETWGYHLNMSTSRRIEVSKYGLTPLLAGMVGTAALFGSGYYSAKNGFRTNQKAPFIYDYVNEATTKFRPLVNTRDEPHANPNLYRRLHVIGNDTLHSPWQTWLRFGAFDLMLALAEARPDVADDMADFLPTNIHIAMKAYAQDITGEKTATTNNELELTQDDFQELVLSEVLHAIEAGDISIEGNYAERKQVLSEWQKAMNGYRSATEYVPLLDWRMREVFYQRMEAKDKDANEIAAKSKLLDDIVLPNPLTEKILQIGLERLASVYGLETEELQRKIALRVTTPPPGRAEARTKLAKRLFAERHDEEAYLYIDWDRVQNDHEGVVIDDPYTLRQRVHSFNPETSREAV